MDRKYIRVLEDVTDIEVRHHNNTRIPGSLMIFKLTIRRDNAVLFGEIPKLPPIDETELEKLMHARVKEVKERLAQKPTVEPETKVDETCVVDHFKEGFEGTVVYVWRGPFKGKLGTIIRLSGSLARISVESAIRGNSVLDVPAECLLAFVTCYCHTYYLTLFS